MKKVLLTLLFVLSLGMINADDFSRPDFAYPVNVINDASSLIEKGQQAKNYPVLIRGLINYQIAQSSIDRDSTVKSTILIDSLKDEVDSNVAKAMIEVLLAKIYASIYQSNRWNYDSRSLPGDSVSDDYTLWDGEMFRNKITGLLKKALSYKTELLEVPLDTYKGVIDYSDVSKPFFPTLYDFVAGQSIDILRSYVQYDSYFPLEYLCGFNTFRNLSFSYQPEVKQLILNLYKELIEYHDQDVAPAVYWNVERLKFTNEYVYSSDQHDLVVTKMYDTLSSLYSSYKSSPYSCEVLLAMRYYVNDDMRKVYAQTLKDAIGRFPSYRRIDCIKNALNEIQNPQIEIRYNSAVVPGDTLTINIDNRNANAFDIYVYKVPYKWEPNNSFDFTRHSSQARLVKTLHVTTSEERPFNIKQTESLVLNSLGCYILVPSLKGRPTRGYYQLLHCSNIYISTGSYGKEKWAYLTNPLTGEPIKGNGSVILTSSNGVKVDSRKVNADGTAELGDKGDFIFAESGVDRYAQYAYPSGSYIPDSTLRYAAHILTDLAVYHPGDTVRWSAVLQSYALNKAQVAERMKVRVALYDANHQEKDSLVCVSDDYGRIYGSFVLPKDGLTGNYSLQVNGNTVSPRSVQYGRCNFMVSDYKLPTYEVIFTQILRNEPASGAVTFKGKVLTFSGFPLSGCQGSYLLSSYPKRWGRYSGNSVTFFTDSVMTDGNGEFTVSLPADLLTQAPVVNGDYKLSISFVSASGELQSADRFFSLGKQYTLTVDMKNNIDISRSIFVDVALTDAMGEKADFPIECKIKRKGSEMVIKTLEFLPSAARLDLAGVESGLYDFDFAPVDSMLADSVAVESIYLYHNDDTELYGLNCDLWMPVTNFIADGNKTIDIMIGTVQPNLWVHYVITGNNHFVTQGWKEFHKGISRWNYSMPSGYDNVKIQLFTVVDYNSISSDITVTDKNSLKKVIVGVENFRDKIVPGTKETWTFTFKDINGNGTSGALMLDMYCKALDKLASHPFTFSPRFGGQKYYRWGSYGMKDMSRDYLNGNFRYLECKELTLPAYQVWGRSLFYHSGIRIRGLGMRKMAVTNDNGSDAVVTEELADDMFYAVEHKAVFNSMSAPMAAGKSMADTDVVEEAEEESGLAQDENSRFSYRASETPLAFFMPTLTFENGQSSITFEVPNANTTWRLQAIAFTKDLQVSTLGLDAIASKPVMVQPNLPRFIRQGDRIELLAEVMNNSDSVAEVNTHIELFNPLTDEVIQNADYISSIEAHGSEIVSIALNDVPDCRIIGYRVRAKEGLFSDGEQSLIPVLPSQSEVIDSYPFYIPKDSMSFEMHLPKIDKNSTVRLQYYNNPAWYLVTALPGLVPDNQGTSLSAVTSLYSAMTASKLLHDNPTFASAIKLWSENKGKDSVLVSMLEKNIDLKTILLNSTPWVSEAENDTRRMSDLVLLLEDSNLEDVYDNAVKKLSVLQCSDGGWAWIEQARYSSEWVTLKVLNLLGQLKRQNSLSPDTRLDGMIDRALRYIDNCMTKRIKRDSKYVDIDYVFIRDMFETPISDGAKMLKLNTINDIKRGWKNYNLYSKAQSGLILMRNHELSVAKEILESIRQYAIYNPFKGMWWQEINDAYPSVSEYGVTALVLDFIGMIDPSSPDIEKISQWLVLQKETTDWGASYQTSQVIYSLFNNGWSINPNESMPVISIDNKRLPVTPEDELLGNIDENISHMKLSGKKLKVEHSGTTASWGAIFVKSNRGMNDINPHACADLSIDKTIYKKVNEGDGVRWMESNSFEVGDEVQVNLTLKVNRNLDYVAIIDERAACFEPGEQLPAPMIQDGIYFYRENRDAVTNIFVDRLPKGTYRLSYNLKVNNSGEFSSGIASVQSQYAPSVTAHSAGDMIKILP